MWKKNPQTHTKVKKLNKQINEFIWLFKSSVPSELVLNSLLSLMFIVASVTISRLLFYISVENQVSQNLERNLPNR